MTDKFMNEWLLVFLLNLGGGESVVMHSVLIFDSVSECVDAGNNYISAHNSLSIFTNEGHHTKLKFQCQQVYSDQNDEKGEKQ